MWRCAVVGFVVATLIAFLIPSEYESTARLMPPDSQQGGGLALMAMLGSGQNGDLAGWGRSQQICWERRRRGRCSSP